MPAFNLTTKKEIKDKAPTALKPAVDAIFGALPRGKTGIFADRDWNKSKTRQWVIKVNADEYESIAMLYGEKPNGTMFNANVAGYKLKFQKSQKKSVGAADAKTTRKQELGSAWIRRRALKDNKKYSKWEDILKDEKYSELAAIYPEISPEWIQGYYAQQAKMLQEYSNPKFDEFNREGGFMGFITQLIKEKFGISQKDNWNPADIWLIQNERSVTQIINETVDGNGSQTIMELNAVLRKLFKEEKVVGVSLKKISGNTARYETYNVDDLGLTETYNYAVKSFKIDLSLKNGEFGTQDARIIVEGNAAEFNFQIKGNDSTKISNLKFEPTAKGAAAARVGKAPVAMVAALLKDKNLDYKNDNNKFPKTAKEFADVQDDYKKTLTFLKQKGVDIEVTTVDEALSNISAAFLGKAHVANSKCMQLKFLEAVLKLKKKEMEEFMTDMVFLAAKKGKRFGPFGKLY